MDQKFIDHFDPTTPIKVTIDPNTIQRQYSQLTEDEKVTIGARLLKMNHRPVSFEQYISDDFYLGSPEITNHGNAIFNIWKKAGAEIYPTPISTRTPYISFGGCIGSGKSTMSKLMGLYMYHRLDCCVNCLSSLGLAGNVKLAFAFLHANEQTAYKDFVQYFRNVFQISPYFKNLYNKPQIRLISSGPRSVGGFLGTQMVYSVLSELGFWRPEDANNKISEALIRYQSRFVDKRFNFGHVVCDSSAKDEDQSSIEKFEEAVPPEELYQAKFAHWVARPELYRESEGKTFEFYKGDSIRMPHIIEPGEDKDLLDPDRIYKCPIQVRRNFLLDPIRSMRDLLGQAYSSKDLFFNGSISDIAECSTLTNLCSDVIDDLDFFDLNDTLYDRLAPMIARIPRQTNLFVHCDIGLKHDVTGIAIAYYDGETTGNDDLLDTTTYPKFKFPLIFGLSRKKGQSTSLDHIFQFIQRLSIDYNVCVSADSFASAGLFQSCERAGIPYEAISVDKTTEPYFMFKNVILGHRATLVYNERLLRECSELRIVANGKNGTHIKIDHPEISSSFEFDYKDRKGEKPGTKDIADAVVGALWSCYKKYSEYMEDGGNGVKKQLNLVTQMVKSQKEDTQMQFQSMLENIF